MSELELKPCPYCGCADIDMASAEWNTGEERYFASCSECDASGPTCADDVSAIAEMRAAEAWDALPRPLRWTSARPTKDGVYWYRETSGRVGLADVNIAEETVWLMSFDTIGDMDELDGQWAGPIPEPQESQP